MHEIQYTPKLDLKSGYFQMPFAKEHKPRTYLFDIRVNLTITSLCLRKMIRQLMFVPCNEICAYQFNKYNETFTLVYLDDIVIFSSLFTKRRLYYRYVKNKNALSIHEKNGTLEVKQEFSTSIVQSSKIFPLIRRTLYHTSECNNKNNGRECFTKCIYKCSLTIVFSKKINSTCHGW
jgi:hypothetical protein